MRTEQEAPAFEISAEDSFGVYEQLVGNANGVHPQHQGFTIDEFAAVLQQPKVFVTDVFHDGRRGEIPQLAPITAFSWLNDDFYRKKFPDDFQDRLLHFFDVPGVTPGDEVKQAIQDLAAQEGRLVFDAPSSDEGYAGRVKALLGELNVDIRNEELIGTQTYFAGEVQLKRSHNRLASPRGMLEVYDEQAAHGVFPRALDAVQEGALLLRSIDPERAELLRQLYDDAYVVLNDHPCKQGLDPDEFHDMLVSDPEVGKLVFVRDGVIETLCLLTTDLKKLSWVNTSFYKRAYKEKYESNQLVWFPGIATDPARQGERNTGHLINLMAKLAEAGDNEFVGLFDFCDLNTGFLDRVFEDMINAAPETAISLDSIAEQKYWALKLGSRE